MILHIAIACLLATLLSACANLASSNEPKLIVQLSHASDISAMALSASGRFLATAALEDLTVQLFDVHSGLQLRTFGAREVRALSFSHSEDLVVTGSRDGTVGLWNTVDGQARQRFRGHRGAVYAVAFSPDDVFVLTGGRDGTVRLWQKEVKKPIWIREFPSEVRAVALSPPDGHLALVSNSLSAHLLDTKNGEEIRCLGGHTGGVTAVAFSRTGELALTGTEDKEVYLWNIRTGKRIQAFRGHGDAITSVAFAFDDRRVLTASKDQTARIWDTGSGEEICQTEKHAGAVSGAAISLGGAFALTASKQFAYAWDAKCKQIQEFKGDTEEMISAVAFSTDGHLIATGSWDKTARLWDVTGGSQVRVLRGHTGHVREVAFSPNGRFVLTGSRDGTARVWDTATGNEIHPFIGHSKEGVSSVSISPPDGGRILTGDEDGVVRLWEAKAPFAQIRQLGPRLGRVESAVFSPLGGRLVLTASENVIYVWDADSGEEINRIRGHAKRVNSVAFSSDGRLALSASDDKSARVWKVEACVDACTETVRLDHPDRVYIAIFSPKDRFILTGAHDGIARLWDASNGELIGSFGGHTSRVIAVAFSPDERFVLTASEDQTARLWDVASRRELATLVSFPDGAWAVVLPDGRFDTNNLEEIRGLHWIMPDDPMRPLSPEIFLRDYYEPRLLSRVLAGEKFKPVRPLGELNRVQPGVQILKVKPGKSPDIAEVTVEVSAAEDTFQRDGKYVVLKTGVYDLRLYRNGQLVGQWPEAGEVTYKGLDTTSEEALEAWRIATKIPLNENGKATQPFTVRVPRREDLREVEFSAYVFNLDRVKGETAHQTYEVRPGLSTVPGRAYLITVGVTLNEDMDWPLTAGARDAKLIQKTLAEKLERSGKYEEVVPVPLITVPEELGLDDEETTEERKSFIPPTKENIKTVLDILAGRKDKLEAARLAQIPPGLRSELRLVQPEDLVILSFSSHGITDANGEFYVLPYNLGKGSGGKVTPELLERSISSQELSLWLSPVDAEQMVMVIDACHSAAAVEVEGFKPGPMGNPGLGQLSYDKRMPILVATQATNSAKAQGYSLLTYALAKEGIGEGKAATLMEALRYAERRVPTLYEERVGKEEKRKVQEPKLFEFERQQIRKWPEITLSGE